MKQPDFKSLSKIDGLRLRAQWKKLQQIKDSSKKQTSIKQFEQALTTAQQNFQLKLAATFNITYPDLPISQAATQIKQLIQDHQVVIVAGETGSGKSTQLAKMCLDLGLGREGLIGHTQPRRLAARAVADRVATELGQDLGQTVGYQVRFHEKTAPQTRVKVMTDGILLNELQWDRQLNAYDTLIIDEAHERSLNIDILFGMLRRIIQQRKDLKLIITSATIALEAFSKFFFDAPIIQVPGKLYPVETHYIPKEPSEDFFAHLLRTIDLALVQTRYDLLVFLSGEGEIFAAKKWLTQRYGTKIEVCPLFARLNLGEQRKIFKTGQKRRIILSTNVAETSITVPNIDAVVDSGLARISRYSYRSKILRLPIEPIAQSSATQRMGRAGRLSKGHAFRMYSEDSFNKREPFTMPEIQRTNLAQVVLQMHPLGVKDLNTFDWLDAPDARHVTDAIKQLERLKAIEANRLTAIGKRMSQMPVEPKLSRILLAAKQNNCLTEILIIISGLCIQDPREVPKDKQEQAWQAHAVYKHPESDFISFLNLWQHCQKLQQDLSVNAFRKHCQKHYLNYLRLLEWRDIHRQLCKMMGKAKLNEKEASYEQIHISLLCGLFETVGLWHHESKQYIGPRQIKFQLSKTIKAKPNWVMAFELIETHRVIANVCAKIEAGWIETASRHLCKYELGELFWDERSGFVKAYEKVNFFGLRLFSKRPATIGQTEQVEATRVFIEQALIEHQLPQFTFIRHNQKVIESLLDFENRVRRLGSLFDRDALAAHYLKCFKHEAIYSVSLMEKWLSLNDEKQLFVTPEMICYEPDLKLLEAQYPSEYHLDDFTLPLEYCFDLRQENDGATLLIPIGSFDLVRHHDFSWGLPGWKQLLCLWVLENIDVRFRRQLPAMRQCVDNLLLHMDTSLEFLEAFKQSCMDLYKVQIPIQSLQALQVPHDLKLNFRVIENEQVLAESRDISVIAEQLSDKLSNQPSVVVSKQYTQWDFGDLPQEQIEIIDNHKVKLIPTLVDGTTHVNLELYRDKAQAQVAHAVGVTRLIMLSDSKKYQYYKKNIKHLAWFKQNLKSVMSYVDYIDDILWVGYHQAFVAHEAPIFRQHDFEQRLDDNKSLLPETLDKLAQILYSIIKQLQSLQLQYSQLKRTKGEALADNLNDIKQQTDLLIYDGFIKEAPYDWLKRYPIYFKALKARMDKLAANPSQDTLKLKQIQPFIKQFNKICQGRVDEGCIRYRWLLEEYRISIFAQPLKPALSISEKKMKLWLKELV